MAQSKHSQRRGLGRWLRRAVSHRRLLLVEAILLLAALETWVEDQVLAGNWPPVLQVLFSMALVVGVFGVLLALAHRLLIAGLSRSHDLVQAMPLPTPLLFIHLLALVGLFYLHAWLLGRPVWPV